MPLLSDLETASSPDNPPALADFPEVRRSVVNLRRAVLLPAASSRDFDRDALAREIRAVLATFEPRLKESATKVTVTLGDKTGV